MCLPTDLSPDQEIQSDCLTNRSSKPKTSASTSCIAAALLSRGLSAYQRGSNDQALAYFNAALQYFTQIQAEQGMGKSLNGLSAVYLEMEAYERSRSYSQAAIAILQDTSAPSDYAMAFYQLGMSHFKLHDLALAQFCFEQALSLYTSLNDTLKENSLLLSLGQVYTQQQQYMFALACYEAVLENLPSSTDPIATQHFLMMALKAMQQLCKAAYGAGAHTAYQTLISQYSFTMRV